MRLAHAILGLAFVACSTLQVEFERDPEADFSRYRTWEWLPGAGPGIDDPRLDGVRVEERIRLAVESGLAARGLERVDEGADLGIGWHAAVATRVDVRELNTFYGFGPGWGDPPGRVPERVVRYVDEGSLVLDAVDLRRRDLVWRGIAQAELAPERDLEARTRTVDEAVERLLAGFPRRPGG